MMRHQDASSSRCSVVRNLKTMQITTSEWIKISNMSWVKLQTLWREDSKEKGLKPLKLTQWEPAQQNVTPEYVLMNYLNSKHK